MLPIVDIFVCGRRARALVDTGCSKTILAPRVCQARGRSCTVIAIDGSEVPCRGEATVSMTLEGYNLKVNCLVVERIFEGVDVILGMDVINRLGGVSVVNNCVKFLGCKADSERIMNEGNVANVAVEELRVDDPDFEARFNGTVWTVRWRWKEGRPPELKNRVDCYESTKLPGTEAKYEQEVERWIAEGWLRPYNGDRGGGVIPLMAVVQANKNKVRPVMDFRELNQFVECHPGADAAACNETLRRWRRMAEPLKMLDLKSAYLQIRVDDSLWPFQQVSYKGRLYCLTRLGFGLNSAPKIMSKILQAVLAKDERIRKNTDSYIDDIIVREDGITVSDVAAHLQKYGLEAKQPEDLEGGRVLGLAISRDSNQKLVYGRGNEVPHLGELSGLTRRQLFSVCGRLVGHYPVCRWLRVACSYVKRESEGKSWDDYIGKRAEGIIGEIVKRVIEEDPVRGEWTVEDTREGKVWCDASSLALGVALEIGGVIVEDAAWLRKVADVGHINVAELDAVLKGVNLALRWDLTSIQIMTDSATVLSWLRSILEGDFRIKVAGMSEMLVKRRLSVVKQLVDELGLSIELTYVESCKNKADALTRVNKKWLQKPVESLCAVSVGENHAQHHFGVDRSLYLARLVNPEVTRKEVEKCVRSCWQCCSIDPAPVKHTPGSLDVSKNWNRLALDVTHYGGKCYFTVIDCGPSRFAIWREVRSENAADISANLSEIFRERGPPNEILMDNSPAFRSKQVAEVCREWNVLRQYRAAYRPSGNGIAERIHRTIKSLAARSKSDPLKVVFWYNLAAKGGTGAASSPCNILHGYAWRHPLASPDRVTASQPPVCIGDKVVVKPPDGRCTSRWRMGMVTGVTSANNIDVDGVPRHILDIRRLFDSDDEEGEGLQLYEDVVDLDSSRESVVELGSSEESEEPVPEARPVRRRQPPRWLQDFECDF